MFGKCFAEFAGRIALGINEVIRDMMEKGVYVVAFSYPVVPKGKARIRTQLSAALSREDILYIAKCFAEVKAEMGL